MTVCKPEVVCVIDMQAAGEREAEMKNLQEQLAQIQPELTRLRTELQEKSNQEDQLKQQNTEKEEKTRKAILAAKQRICLLNSECSKHLKNKKYTSHENETSSNFCELKISAVFIFL